jgi:hypothetical protein
VTAPASKQKKSFAPRTIKNHQKRDIQEPTSRGEEKKKKEKKKKKQPSTVRFFFFFFSFLSFLLLAPIKQGGASLFLSPSLHNLDREDVP